MNSGDNQIHAKEFFFNNFMIKYGHYMYGNQILYIGALINKQNTRPLPIWTDEESEYITTIFR